MSPPTQFSFYGNDVILFLEVTSPPTQCSFYDNDVILETEMTSTPTQFSYYGNDVIPLKVLEFSRKIFIQSELSSF